MRKRKEIKRIVCMILLLSCFINRSVHAEELSLYARSALLMDASNGRVLYEENGYKVMPMASTTKIMTCILALEWLSKASEEERKRPVIVSAYAARMPKVHLGMRTGEEYALEDLLYSLMLESHNDTAVAIAEHIDGSVEKFAKRMNEKAKELGCEHTNFITPNGLDAEEKGKAHSTTAYDLGLIASYAIQNEEFLKIISTRNYVFEEKTGGRQIRVDNKNRFLDLMEGAVGIKTGFTADAGYCFVGAVKLDGKNFVSVVLGSGWPPNKNWKWKDTMKLMEYGMEEYESKDLDKKLTYEPLPVVHGVKDSVKVCIEKKKEGDLVLLLSERDKTAVIKEMKHEVSAPVKKGEVVGYECYYINGQLYKRYEIKTAESVELRTYFYCLRQIFMIYF